MLSGAGKAEKALLRLIGNNQQPLRDKSLYQESSEYKQHLATNASRASFGREPCNSQRIALLMLHEYRQVIDAYELVNQCCKCVGSDV